jgi:hypothetical protein
MKEYDSIETIWKPYVMFFNKPNVKNDIYSLDKYGLRHNNFDEESLNINEFENSIFDKSLYKEFDQTAAIVGGSATFGTGASKDRYTISSILSNKSNIHYFNLGCSAFNGFQEIINFQIFQEKMEGIKKIIVYSGLNDIFLTYFNEINDDGYDPHYFSKIYLKNIQGHILSKKKRIIHFFFSDFVDKNFDWKNSSYKKIFYEIFKKKNNVNKSVNKNDILRKILNKNLKIWANYQKSLNVEVIYVLQPFSNWCTKENSEEEDQLFSITENSKIKIYEIFKELDHSSYLEYKKILEDLTRKYNLKFLDANNHIDAKFNKEWLFVDRGHLNDRGNEIISEFIHSKI